jgi:uncharacterized protein YndB with AHSA1/START domain
MGSEDIVRVDAGPRKVSRRTQVAAPAAELFDLVADPHRHHELDGSGTVRAKVKGPDRLSEGARFTVAMTMRHVPYRITSRVTEFDANRVLEWRHPLGHRWRWEFAVLGPDLTEVTETFDYSHAGPAGKVYELLRFPATNAQGIRATLRQLRARYS